MSLQDRSGLRRAERLRLSCAALAMLAGAVHAADDPRLRPGEVRVLELDPQDLSEVVPDTVYMRHWFGTGVSVALFRVEPGQGQAAQPALHSHGTEFAVQLAGDATVVDTDGRRYPLREGDVYLIRADVPHTGDFGTATSVILSVVTPPRPEYAAEDGAPYYPGSGTARAAAASAVAPGQTPTVRTLFNLNDVAGELREIVPGQLYFRHWHGEDVTVSVTRMVRTADGHFPGKVNVHGEEVALAVKGSLDMTIDGERHHVPEGQLLIIPPELPHTGTCLDDECLLVSWFTPERSDEWGPEDNDQPDLRFLDRR